MHGKKKWAFNLIFLALVMAATIYGVFRGHDLGTLRELMRSAAWGWWILGLVLVVLFILGESLILHDIMRTLGTRHKLSHCFLYSFIGFFFSCITPSAGGGQPAQIYFMKKDNIDMAVSVPVMMLVTITYKMVLVLYALMVLIVRPRAIMSALEPVRYWFYLGIFLNVVFVSLYVMLVFWPATIERFLRFGIRLLGHFLSEAKIERLYEKLVGYMAQYRNVADCFRTQKLMIGRVMILTIIQRTILFAVTYLSMRSFGITGHSMFTVIVLQAMISVGTDLLPLPGGMGASETMFMRIFPPLCGKKLLLPVLLVSRGISYYGQLLISAVFTGAATFIIGKEKGKDKRDEKKYHRVL